MPEPSAAEQRNGDIWSTRVQKELLALTTDNADAEAIEEVRVMLPSFCQTLPHTLDIAQGICHLAFQLDIAKGEMVETVVVKMDVSLPRRLADGKPDASMPAYPFMAPTITLQSGQASFPQGSTIQNGDRIAMDLDWTEAHILACIASLST
jgi:hypothetical protein